MKPNTEKTFWGKVAVGDPNDCWRWLGGLFPNGYGQIQIRHQKWVAHRFAWFITYGDIPVGLYVLHKCDNPLCCNPNHLFVGTQGDNMNDKVAKNRHATTFGELNKMAKLNSSQVKEIRDRLEKGESQKELANRYNVSQSAISKIATNRYWKHT